MEQDRKARDQEPVEVWDLAAVETAKDVEIPRGAAKAEAKAKAKVRGVVEGEDRIKVVAPAVAGTSKTVFQVLAERSSNMPRGDGTGPQGQGPMTGRAKGFCAENDRPGFVNPIPGRGFGRFGRRYSGGWGRRHWFDATGLAGWQRAAMGLPVYGEPSGGFPVYAATHSPPITEQQQLDVLRGQVQYFEETLEGIRERIRELEAKASRNQ